MSNSQQSSDAGQQGGNGARQIGSSSVVPETPPRNVSGGSTQSGSGNRPSSGGNRQASGGPPPGAQNNPFLLSSSSPSFGSDPPRPGTAGSGGAQAVSSSPGSQQLPPIPAFGGQAQGRRSGGLLGAARPQGQLAPGSSQLLQSSHAHPDEEEHNVGSQGSRGRHESVLTSDRFNFPGSSHGQQSFNPSSNDPSSRDEPSSEGTGARRYPDFNALPSVRLLTQTELKEFLRDFWTLHPPSGPGAPPTANPQNPDPSPQQEALFNYVRNVPATQDGYCRVTTMAPTKAGGYVQITPPAGYGGKQMLLHHATLALSDPDAFNRTNEPGFDAKSFHVSHRCGRPSCASLGHAVLETVQQNEDRKRCQAISECGCNKGIFLMCQHRPICIPPRRLTQGVGPFNADYPDWYNFIRKVEVCHHIAIDPANPAIKRTLPGAPGGWVPS